MVPEGIAFSEITAGTGGKPEKGQVAIINYTGKLADGKVFDTGEAQPMLVGGNIPGFDEALERMETGGKYTVTIPSDLAYGAEERRHPMTGELVIPANSDLTFDVELLEVVSRADFERRMQIMQQMQEMQQQQQAGGAPGAPAE